ncbi:PREDICTED: fibroleukin-like [Branchiostoma belcheri]|uniref:Fibroleukin-like n=1 Tax=Branchiostoma belcheri TaxID=7741 RepID=A0A6P5ATP3_BRABE|nr:PREDICTED: fibroleukin-like [Branchiostoma belcheri]
MASFLLLVVFLLFGSFSARAQAGYSPPGARTATGRLKTKVDRLSSLVETLLSQQSDLTARVDSLSAQLSEERDKNRELALNLTQALHKLDSMTSTLYEHDTVIKQRLQCACEKLIPVTEETSPTESTGPVIEGDCAEYYSSGRTTSGVYRIGLLPGHVDAYCDMDTAGGSWTLIQRRQDGSVPFNRTWEEYKHGFGNKSGEYWLGNENIHLLTNQRNYTLRVELEDWDGWILYAEYTSFWLSGESDQYRIHMSGYWGTDRNAMKLNNEQMFSTVDRDNDEDREYDCSQERGQGGWWFASCGYTYLNGRYLGNCGDSCPWLQGIIWGSWKGYFYSLKSGSMKIRPTEEVSTTKPRPSVPPADTETDDPTIEGDCAEYYSSGRTTSGVYRISLLPGHVEAYCDMDTAEGGWTVIQRRVDGSVPFNRTWEEYKRGFGNKSGEYWLGNENIHLLTNQKNYRLRIDMQDWDNQTRYAEYSTFRVLGEYGDQYRLHVSGYNGTAGDCMTRYFSNDGMRFSTVDRDNDLNSGHCCQRRGQGGWWFGNCGNSFLNGRYLVSCGRSCEVWQGVIWHSFTGSRESLKSVSMKIRPY